MVPLLQLPHGDLVLVGDFLQGLVCVLVDVDALDVVQEVACFIDMALSATTPALLARLVAVLLAVPRTGGIEGLAVRVLAVPLVCPL